MAPEPPAEAPGLLALMLLHDSRRDARLDEAGDLVLLEDQDRGRWNGAQIGEALPLVEEALRGGPGPYARQAAIAALHRRAERAEDTDWPQIARLYDLLLRVQPSPVVSLNRAAAVAMVEGPGTALALVDELGAGGDLDRYHLLHAARADLLRRLGARDEAAASHARALELVTNDAERRFLERRLQRSRTAPGPDREGSLIGFRRRRRGLTRAETLLAAPLKPPLHAAVRAPDLSGLGRGAGGLARPGGTR